MLLALLDVDSGFDDEELPEGWKSSPKYFFSLAVGFPAVRKEGFSTLANASAITRALEQ